MTNKAMMGPCFTPRKAERPPYPSALPFIFWQGIIPTITNAFWTIVMTLMLAPAYEASVQFWKQQSWSERLHLTIMLQAAAGIMYFGYNSLFSFFESFGYLSQYKIGRTVGQKKAAEKYIGKTLIKQAVSKAFVSPLLAYFALYPLCKYFGSPKFDEPIPTVTQLAGYYMAAYWFNEVGFYWAHRLLHAKSLYWLHKDHHNYTGTVGFAAEHAGMLETVLSNLVPTLGGCIVFGAHPFVLCVWIMRRLFNTYDGHSGYCLDDTLVERVGLTNFSAFHDYHHTFSFKGNFGHPLLDYCCGTMDFWIAGGGRKGYLEMQYKREHKRNL